MIGQNNYKGRSLDEWYQQINQIYLDRNFHRDSFSIFAHLVEVIGAMSLLATPKKKLGITPVEFIPKAFGWWMVLCGKVGVRSVEALVWRKFPGICPYCELPQHKKPVCDQKKLSPASPSWSSLAKEGKQNKRPRTPREWKQMFATIYEVNDTETYPSTFARLCEELGELAEALRTFPIAPGYFLSEAADVFAWLMHLINLWESTENVAEAKDNLTEGLHSEYPGKCKYCGNQVCTCPPILLEALGRIAKEVPEEEDFFAPAGALIPANEAHKLFEMGTRSVAVGGVKVQATADEIGEIKRIVQLLKQQLDEGEALALARSSQLSEALELVADLAVSQRLTQSSIEQIGKAIAMLPTEGRNAVVSFLTGFGSSAWAAAVLAIVKTIVPSV